MVFPKIASCLLIASLCLTSCRGQYGAADYEGSYDGFYRGPETEYGEARGAYRGDDVPAPPVARASPAVPIHAAPAYALHGTPAYVDTAYAPAPTYAPASFFPSSDFRSYHLYHKDHPQAQVEVLEDEAPQQDHKKDHSHDHGTSSISFYQNVKGHEHKFKLEQKHGKKHGSFHGVAHPYAYGGLKVHHF